MRNVCCMIVALLVISMCFQVSAPVPRDGARTDLPPNEPGQSPVTFTDVASSAGFAGIGGTFFSWGDYDDDGDQDLLVDGWRLFRNGGAPSWGFTDVTQEANLSGGSGNGVWADYDNDGCLDFYSHRLWRNDCDGTFTDVTVEAGSIMLPAGWPYGAAGWADYDRDGYVDLYITGSEDWNGGSPKYYTDFLWRNNGNGTFKDVSAKAFGNGITWIENISPKYGRGVAWADFNNDDWPDLFVTNYRQQYDYLWQNDKDGTFTEMGIMKGVRDAPQDAVNNPDPCMRPGHGVGSAWGDYDNDGDFDLYVGTLNHKDWRTSDDSLLFQNSGSGGGYTFTNVRGMAGMPVKPYDLLGPNLDGSCSGSPTVGYWTGPQGDELIMEGVWGDFDSDSWLDLFAPQIYDLNYAYAYLYHNNGNGTFTDVATSAGVHNVYDTYGGSWADYDNDGDLDLVTGGRAVGGSGAPGNVKLFRNNDHELAQSANSWLQVKLEGCGGNACAIGARVNVTNGTLTQMREVEGGTGAHAQQNSMVLQFGFGDYYGTVDVGVRWTNGETSFLPGTPLNNTLVIGEPNCTSPPLNIMTEFYEFDNNLNVTWDLSADDGAGLDNVVNYAVYRSARYDRNGLGYEFIAAMPKGTNYYVDIGKGIADNSSYHYLIKANNSLGNQVWTGQAGKFSRFLPAGFNLVSLPVDSMGDGVANVLRTISYKTAWAYDSSGILDPWKTSNPLKPFNDLATIDHTMGFFVDVVSDDWLMVTGRVHLSVDIGLKAGWNLIGYPSFNKANVSRALSAVPYERVEGFDASAPSGLRLFFDADVLDAGLGLWVKAGADCTLTVTQY